MLELVQANVNNGASNSKAATSIVTTFVQNRAKIATFASVYEYLAAEYTTMTFEEAQKRQQFLFAYISSMDIATAGIAQTNGSTTYQSVPNLSDAVAVTVVNISDPAGSKDALASAIDTIRRLDSKIDAALTRYWQDAESVANRAESAIEDIVGDGLMLIIGPEYEAVLAALTLLNTLLVRAQNLVKTTQRITTSLLQKAVGSTKSLPEILEDLANLQTNVYGNLSFRTRFVSCYVTGSASALLAELWAAMIALINKYLAMISAALTAYTNAANNALGTLICIASKIIDGLTGIAPSITSTAVATSSVVGVPLIVSYTMKCTLNLGFASLNPSILRELTKIQTNLDLLMGLLQVNLLKHVSLDDSMKKYQSTASLLAMTTSDSIIGAALAKYKAMLAAANAC